MSGSPSGDRGICLSDPPSCALGVVPTIRAFGHAAFHRRGSTGRAMIDAAAQPRGRSTMDYRVAEHPHQGNRRTGITEESACALGAFAPGKCCWIRGVFMAMRHIAGTVPAQAVVTISCC